MRPFLPAQVPPNIIMRSLIMILTFVTVGVNAITSMTAMPGFPAMRRCAQYPLSFAVRYDMKCNNDICFCNRFPEAMSRLINSISTSSCSGTDIESATLMLSSFCRQVPSLTYLFDSPVQTNVGVSTPANGAAVTPTVTAAPGNSGTKLTCNLTDVVVTLFSTTTFTTTNSKGQASVITSVITTTRATPEFKSSAATAQSFVTRELVAWIVLTGFVSIFGLLV